MFDIEGDCLDKRHMLLQTETIRNYSRKGMCGPVTNITTWHHELQIKEKH